jgi:tetratricopeptide (TPR) repeat protein
VFEKKLVIPNLVAMAFLLVPLPPALAETTQPYSARAVTHFNKGVDLANSGEFKRAISEYKQAIASDARMEEAYSNLGVALSEEDDYEAAIQSYTQALTIRPGRVRTLNALGSALYAVGRTQEAKEAWAKTIGIDPNCTSALYNLGRAFENENDYSGALVAYSRVLRVDADVADVRERLADIGKRCNMTDVQAFIAQINQESVGESTQAPPVETQESNVDLVTYSNPDDSFQHAYSVPITTESYDSQSSSAQTVEFSTDVSTSHAHRQFASALSRSMNSQSIKSPAGKAPIRIAAVIKPQADPAKSTTDRDFAMFIHSPLTTH